MFLVGVIVEDEFLGGSVVAFHISQLVVEFGFLLDL